MAKFINVTLTADAARSFKRLTIHLADRHIRLRPVDDNAGKRSVARIVDMKRHPGNYGISEQAAALLSPTSSPHLSGNALDVALTELRGYDAIAVARYGTIYDYAEHVAAHYGLRLDRPLYPAYAGERNHFVKIGKAVAPLSPTALVRFRKASAL